MLKRQSKMLSIALIFVFCMSFMFAGFAAPDVAQAAVTYQALSVPSVQSNTAGQPLGILQIDIDNCAAIRNGDVLTISFSSEINLEPPAGFTAVNVPISATRTLATNQIVIPATIGTATNALDPANSFTSASIVATRTTLDIEFSGNIAAGAAPTDPGRILVYLPQVTVGSVENEVVATILGPGGGAFPTGSVTLAKVDAGSVIATIKSAKTFGADGLPITLTGGGTDSIIITESTPGTIVKNTDTTDNVVKLKLPQGFRWTMAAGNWAWGYGSNSLGAAIGVSTTDSRVLEITVPQAMATNSTTGAGQIRFIGAIAVDDSVAKLGDVVATLYDTAGRITDTEITIGKYADYAVKVVEGTTPELFAGQSEQKLGEFFIEEGIAGSILANRSIKLTLPQGVKWWGGYRDEATLVPAGVTNQFPTPAIKKGASITINDADATNAGTQAFFVGTNSSGATDTGRTIRFSFGNASTTAAKIKFEQLKVDVAPDFVGDIKLTVSSSAGVEGEVVVGTVKPAVEITADGVKNVRIGEQNQVLGDIMIKETKKEKVRLLSNTIYTNGINYAAFPPQAGAIELVLPAGAAWSAGFPTVEVTEGDLELNKSSMSKPANNIIRIPVKSESTKPSTIKISGLKATIDRTVPEGDFAVAVTGFAINETGGTNLPFAQYEDVDVVVANCITPAPDEGTEGAAAGQFKIDSNIYQLNGVAKVMEVAPYIKSGRTYVPVRYLGYALGVAEADVVWDEASQKVTLTKGDNVVELTIGSATITVNGEAQTMDVAPEITNGRTMLPARYVAEGLGYVVGWDPGTRTVLISK